MKSIVAAALAFWSDLIGENASAPVIGAGQERARARLSAKLKANEAIYAALPAKPKGRQVRRREGLKACKRFAAGTPGRRGSWREYLGA